MTSPALILVRHARPQIEADRPPAQWRLSAEGRAATQALAERLSPLAPAAIVASSEAKAVETAEIVGARLGLHVTSDPAFDEHRRPGWRFDPNPTSQIARVLRVLSSEQEEVEGAETAYAARRRFAAGIAAHTERPLLVVSHGTGLSLYAASVAKLDPQDLWRSLGFPEALVLGADGRLLERIPTSAHPGESRDPN
jgi:broad specificity phosphatase PhoE